MIDYQTPRRVERGRDHDHEAVYDVVPPGPPPLDLPYFASTALPPDDYYASGPQTMPGSLSQHVAGSLSQHVVQPSDLTMLSTYDGPGHALYEIIRAPGLDQPPDAPPDNCVAACITTSPSPLDVFGVDPWDIPAAHPADNAPQCWSSWGPFSTPGSAYDWYERVCNAPGVPPTVSDQNDVPPAYRVPHDNTPSSPRPCSTSTADVSYPHVPHDGQPWLDNARALVHQHDEFGGGGAISDRSHGRNYSGERAKHSARANTCTPDPRRITFYRPRYSQYFYPRVGPSWKPMKPIFSTLPLPLRSTSVPQEQVPKRLTVACIFCKKRKISCVGPPDDEPDRTCTNCVQRKLQCVYPDRAYRGIRPRKDASP